MAIRAGDLLFLDTNVLLSATDQSRPHYQSAQSLFQLAGETGVHLAVNGQVLREYLVVATRPVDVNGLGMNPSDALANLVQFRQHTVFLDEREAVSTRLLELVKDLNLADKRIHDANIAATMAVHGISHLVTGNAPDFEGMAPLSLLTPQTCVDEIKESL